MSKTATVTLSVTPQPLPDGKVFDHIDVTLSKADGTVVETIPIDGVTETTATFLALEAGDFIVTAAAMAADGSTLGSPVSANFSVPVEATFPAPVSVSVSLA